MPRTTPYPENTYARRRPCFHGCGLSGCHCNETPLCDCGGCGLHCTACDGSWLDRLSALRIRSRSAALRTGATEELRRLILNYELWAYSAGRMFSDLRDRRLHGDHVRNARGTTRINAAARRVRALAADVAAA